MQRIPWLNELRMLNLLIIIETEINHVAELT
jgi:hypothetical protein